MNLIEPILILNFSIFVKNRPFITPRGKVLYQFILWKKPLDRLKLNVGYGAVEDNLCRKDTEHTPLALFIDTINCVQMQPDKSCI